MKTRCPCCGAENSLDALIAHQEARRVLWLLAQAGGALSSATVMYLGLFRPTKSALSPARMASLLDEILPDMQRGQIVRNGQTFSASPEIWLMSLRTVLQARDAGKLSLPLKSHGYLYEVIAKQLPVAQPANMSTTKTTNLPKSKAAEAIHRLEQLK